MGYDLHITRRVNWTDDNGPIISADEWRMYVQSDPELRMDESLGGHFAVWSGNSKHEIPWLAWCNGNIGSKNPDPPLIRKMAALALALDAVVQGDDGENYNQDGLACPLRSLNLLERLKRWWSNLLAPAAVPFNESDIPFKVGDRVQDIFGDKRIGTIIHIDLRAQHGLGLISVQYDDGRLLHSAANAHGLKAISARAEL